MWSLRDALSFHGLMTLSRRSIKDLHKWDLLFGRVVAQFVAFGFGEDAEEGRIAVRYPMPESKTPDEYGDTGEDGIEEVEGPHRSDADEVEQRPFNAQIGERLVQALEDSICAMLLLWFVGHKFLVPGAG